MVCGHCGDPVAEKDNFCRSCGTALQGARLPVLREPPLPASPLESVAPVVARGAAVVVAGTLLRWAARQLLRTLDGAPSSPRTPVVSNGSPAAISERRLEKGETLDELFIYRRVRLRQ